MCAPRPVFSIFKSLSHQDLFPGPIGLRDKAMPWCTYIPTDRRPVSAINLRGKRDCAIFLFAGYPAGGGGNEVYAKADGWGGWVPGTSPGTTGWREDGFEPAQP